MNKIVTTTIAVGLIASVASAGVSTTFDFASAYVFRGATLNNSAVFQPGIEASGFGMNEAYGEFTGGAWGNYNFDGYKGSADYQFSEVDWYAAYSLPTYVEKMDLFVGYTQYTYGGGTKSIDDKEVNLGIGYEVAGVDLGAAVYFGVGGGIDKNIYYELAVGYGMEFSEQLIGSVDARFGFAHIDGGASGFSDYDIGVSLDYALSEKWSAGGSLAYIGQGDDDVLTDAAYNIDVVAMLGLACEM